MDAERDALTLFCTDAAYERYGAECDAIVPALRTVQLSTAGGGRSADVGDSEIASLDIAFFSGDVWPDHSARFMKVALQAPRLQWLHVFNAGTDHPVFGMFRERGVRLTTSAGASARPIAHTVMMQILALSRRAHHWHRDQQAARWGRREFADVEGRTMVIVGLGSIGTEVAKLGAAFGMHVIGLRRTPTGNEPCATWTIDRLHEALAIADDVVLAAPATADTEHLINADSLAVMRPGAHLVNVGRGELVDEVALLDALNSGHLGGAALDVFAVEPLPADSPLWTHPNVIVTPHSAGQTPLSRHRAALAFIDNLRRYVGGDSLVNELP